MTALVTKKAFLISNNPDLEVPLQSERSAGYQCPYSESVSTSHVLTAQVTVHARECIKMYVRSKQWQLHSKQQAI